MKVGGRLAKLEEKAREVIRCAWCRVSLIEDHEQKARGRTVTVDYVMRSCAFCGNEFRVPLDGLTPKERESFLLWAHTRDGETYRDERAYAAEQWWMARAWVRIFTEPERRAAALTRLRERQRQAQKPDRYTREREELKAEAAALQKAEARRQRRLYGPRTFPLAATIRALKGELKALEVGPYTTGYGRHSAAEKAARQILIQARRMAACEAVLWGAVEPETAALIETRAAEVAAFETKRAERDREQAEALREAVEKQRGANARFSPPERGDFSRPAEPERAAPHGHAKDPGERLLEIIGQHSPAAAYQRGDSIPLGEFYDPKHPEAAHVPEAYDPNHPDAVQFQRSTPPDPTRGLKPKDVGAGARGGRRYYRGEFFDGDR